MFSHGKQTRTEWRVTYRGWGGIVSIEWRLTEESALKFAEGKDVISIEHAERVLDY
jgi:hypothetical protein